MITKEDLFALAGLSELVLLEDLQREIAPQAGNRAFHRWAKRSVKGHTLTAIQLGSRYFSTRKAVMEFLHLINQ